MDVLRRRDIPLVTSSSPSCSTSVLRRVGLAAPCGSLKRFSPPPPMLLLLLGSFVLGASLSSSRTDGTFRFASVLLAVMPLAALMLRRLALKLGRLLLWLGLVAALPRRLGTRLPIGLYKLCCDRLFHADPKLNESSLSLCSFLTGARYFGLGIGSPGL